MRFRIIAVAAAAATGLVLGIAPNAVAVPAIADISYSVVADVSHITKLSNMSQCAAVLLSEQVSPGGPGYVSGYIENVHAGKTCLGWLERSTNGGMTWSISSSVVIVPSAPGFTDWVKLGEQQDVAPLRARVCFQIGSATKIYCTRGASLKPSTAPVVGFPVQLSYLRARVINGTPTGYCTAYVSTTSIVKKATTRADGFFNAFGATCVGSEQTSVDGGKTWTTVSRFFVFTSKAPAFVWSFTAVHPDGIGRIARACVSLGLGGKPHCTAAV
jgi:hypothetical protein